MTVVELEPQTLWQKVWVGGAWSYQATSELVADVASLPLAKLVHGVGQPLGGSTDDPVPYADLLADTVDQLGPAWVSEHLSFNRVETSSGVVEAGFLLPPRQDASTVRLAAQNVIRYGEALGRPVAFETGVNYLRTRPGEMADGEFWRAVAEQAQSGILLDLHNLWCNELNGRGRVLDVIGELPLERVWEVHLAGGMDMDGYWLDAHSGGIPDPLVQLAAEVVPRLPNLGAIIFEVLPEHFDRLGLDGVSNQIDELVALWAVRPPSRVAAPAASIAPSRLAEGDLEAVRAWERAVHAAICGFPAGGTSDLDDDPGVGIYRTLVADFRRSALAATLRHTTTFLLLVLGPQEMASLLDQYFAEHPPDAYRAIEASNFAAFLQRQRGLLDRTTHLGEVLSFEQALVRASVFSESSQVEWTADPTRILQALDEARLPGELPTVESSMLVTV